MCLPALTRRAMACPIEPAPITTITCMDLSFIKINLAMECLRQLNFWRVEAVYWVNVIPRFTTLLVKVRRR